MEIQILYEDEELLILHKPSGVASVKLATSELPSAVEFALKHCPVLAERFPDGEAGLLHRLDNGTSGVLAFAKTPEEHARLKALWKTPAVRKTYRALVAAKPPKVPTTLTTPLGHDDKSAKRMVALTPTNKRKIRGKPLKAITHLLSAEKMAALFDLTIEIETGVMHQIRCHLASVGAPILGDPIYRGPEASRLMLHAWKLELPLKSGATLTVQARMPW